MDIRKMKKKMSLFSDNLSFFDNLIKPKVEIVVYGLEKYAKPKSL
jgi:hypothetical protein